MLRLISVTSSRADVGILAPVWRACVASSQIELHLLVTGMHIAANAPPIEDLPNGVVVHRGGSDMGGFGAADAAKSMASIAAFAGSVFDEINPYAVMVMGDRLDMLPTATASLPFNIPLVHLHGGEVTEGALDDRGRHAMTKLAHFHCVSSKGAERRLIAMGEEAWRIRRTGAPGIDTLLTADVMVRRHLLDAVGFEHEPDETILRLVTLHPETNSPDPAAAYNAVRVALDILPPRPTVFTAPNSDPGGAAMKADIEKFVAERGWARFHDTLGPKLYPNALRHADMMIGNSSSGIIEAGTFGLPVVDVGDRQKGRDRGEHVLNVMANVDLVIRALEHIGERPRRFNPQSLYGDGRASARIVSALLELPNQPRLLRKQMAGA